jgi:hypothetical protein
MSIMNVEKKQQQLLYTERRIHIEPTHFCLSCNIDTKKREEKETNTIMKGKTKIIKTMLPSFFLYAKKSNH